MTTDATAKPATASGSFVVLWILSLVAPFLVSTILKFAVLPYRESAWGYATLVGLSLITWPIMAFLQFRLLRHRLRHSVPWLVVTILGGMAGDTLGLLGEKWLPMYLYPLMTGGRNFGLVEYYAVTYLPPVCGGLILGATLGIVQGFYVGGSRNEGLLWACTSSLGGTLGSILHVAIYPSIVRAIYSSEFSSVFSDPFITGFTGAATREMMILGAYGVLTGIVMRRLLIRQARRQKEALVGQFD